MMPTGEETPGAKLVWTMGLQFNSDAMLVLAKYFGVEKRATIPFLENLYMHARIMNICCMEFLL